MALAPVSGPLLNKSDATCSKLVFQPEYPFEKCGTEDPRVVQHDGVTYLFYTAYDCNKAALSLATTRDPTDANGWTRHGPLFPSLKWSKSGAVLIRDSPPHYMFFGDSTLVPGLRCVVPRPPPPAARPCAGLRSRVGDPCLLCLPLSAAVLRATGSRRRRTWSTGLS